MIKEKLPRIETEGKTVREVLAEITRLENEAANVPEESRKWRTGPWDEYFSEGYPRDQKWPTSWRWVAVYVVTGGSEGTYLHIDVVSPTGASDVNERKLLILGKTCAWGEEKWRECYESAGRIAWMLGA